MSSASGSETGTVYCTTHKGFWIQRPVGNVYAVTKKFEKRECPGCITDLAVKASLVSISSSDGTNSSAEVSAPQSVFSQIPGATAPKPVVVTEQVSNLYIGDGDLSGFYTGTLVDKKRHGKGTFKYNQSTLSGDVYEGDWVEDARSGHGKLTYANGNIHEGQYQEDLRNGYGKYTFANGNVHEGEYRNDMRHGKGKYTWASGNVYEGDFVENKMCGHGKYTWANGNVFEGEYVDDKRHGHGTYRYKSGHVHEGAYVNGDKCGKGKYTWANGDVFEGEYLEDKKNGPGVMTYANGTVKTGVWQNDKFVEA